MIIEGLKLMVIGMVIVYVFLIVLMLLVILSSRIFKGRAVATAPRNINANIKKDEITAVISAAIAAYRARKQNK